MKFGQLIEYNKRKNFSKFPRKMWQRDQFQTSLFFKKAL